MRFIIAAGDAAAQLELLEVEFVLAEGGGSEDVVEGGKHFVGAFFTLAFFWSSESGVYLAPQLLRTSAAMIPLAHNDKTDFFMIIVFKSLNNEWANLTGLRLRKKNFGI